MRSILAASAAIFIASSAPGMASGHTWCARSNGDCSFTSHRQCIATLDGRRAGCVSDPHLTYQTQPRWQYADEAHDYDFWHDRPFGWDHWR